MQNKYFSKVIGWCVDYFTRYNDAPKRHIVDIFDLKKKEVKEDEYKFVEEHGKITESLTAEYYKQIAKKYKDKLEKLKRLRGGK